MKKPVEKKKLSIRDQMNIIEKMFKDLGIEVTFVEVKKEVITKKCEKPKKKINKGGGKKSIGKR